MRRQSAGDTKGNKPSITRTSANASQSVSLSKPYFLAGAAPPGAPPRIALKNSDDAGSSTITSPFLEKLAL